MEILGAVNYDPGSAVSKATSALLAMTAFDTTNLRLAVTVPAHGMLHIRLLTTVSGSATATPQVLLGVMNGSNVVGRQIANAQANTSATTWVTLEAHFTVTGLSPGAITLDAAYAVQILVAATNIKYGGPNNNSGNNAWGGFLFEIYDPKPVGVAGANLTAVAPASTALSTAQWTNARATLQDNLDAAVSSRAAAATALSSATWTGGRAALLDNLAYLDAAVSTRAAASTALSTATWTGARGAALDYLNASSAAILAAVNALPAGGGGQITGP